MSDDKYKLPDDAVFPPSPTCTAYWDDESWYKWWQANGARTLKSEQEQKDRLLQKLAETNE